MIAPVRRLPPPPAPLDPPPTWGELIEREPRLARLAADVRAVRDPGHGRGFCRNVAWHGFQRSYAGSPRGSFRRRLRYLVGSNVGRRDARLAHADSERLAFRHLYHLLPPCRDCFCADDRAAPSTPGP